MRVSQIVLLVAFTGLAFGGFLPDAGQCFAGLGQPIGGLAGRAVGFGFQARRFGRAGAGRIGAFLGTGGGAPGGVHLASCVFQPVALFEAHRRAGGRFGGGVISVPAPEGAISCHQPLALVEERLQTPACFHIGDDTDLAQPPMQWTRALNMVR